MLIGPIFLRDLLVLPRRPGFHLLRSAYLVGQFVLMWTAWQVLVGFQDVLRPSDLASFHNVLFLAFTLLQLTLVIFFGAIVGVTSISREKDRRTLILLLLTRLSDWNIVSEKFLGSLLRILALLLAALPVYALTLLLGGVDWTQVLAVQGIMLGSSIVAIAFGVLIASWREKTFQSLALTLLTLTLLMLGNEILVQTVGAENDRWNWFLTSASPYRVAALVIEGNQVDDYYLGPSLLHLGLALLLALLCLIIATLNFRRWNPRGEPIQEREAPEPETPASELAKAELSQQTNLASPLPTPTSVENPSLASDQVSEAATTLAPLPQTSAGTVVPVAATSYQAALSRLTQRKPIDEQELARRDRMGRVRHVQGNPILWREIVTLAYGTRPILVKIGFLIVAGLFLGYLLQADPQAMGQKYRTALAAAVVVPTAVLSLLLINTQALTAITTERDLKSIDLLLVTDLTPNEFVIGKMLGVLYNAKEMLLAPMLLFILTTVWGLNSSLELVYGLAAFLIFVGFVVVLGIHAGLRHATTQLSLANSLATVFLLFVGMFLCLFLILKSGRFEGQWLSFILFIVFGSIGLWLSLRANAPSTAISMAASLMPAVTFYCLIALVVGDRSFPFMASSGVYGFAIAALLIPLLSEFDVATGRTNIQEL